MEISLNLDKSTVEGFGKEWAHFNHSQTELRELTEIFNQYFAIFPWHELDMSKSVGADFGCGSGRWARLIAPKINHLYLIDASLDAINVARQNLVHQANVTFINSSIEEAELAPGSLDFAFSLGVLHHLPRTFEALQSIVGKLKKGAPFLIYLYYKMDNRPTWYRALWKTSDSVRAIISRMPFRARLTISQIIACTIYWPFARTAWFLEKINCLPGSFPLAYYRKRSFYIMRNDALDRLGTRLEQRFSRLEIQAMLENAGLEKIRFSEHAPYWCAVGYKKG